LVGDVNKRKNGFDYKVLGTNANASLGNSSWYQQNVTHKDQRIRKIFRFDLKDAPPFAKEQIPIKFAPVSDLSLAEL